PPGVVVAEGHVRGADPLDAEVARGRAQVGLAREQRDLGELAQHGLAGAVAGGAVHHDDGRLLGQRDHPFQHPPQALPAVVGHEHDPARDGRRTPPGAGDQHGARSRAERPGPGQAHESRVHVSAVPGDGGGKHRGAAVRFVTFAPRTTGYSRPMTDRSSQPGDRTDPPGEADHGTPPGGVRNVAARVVLRPLANPLPLGFLALAAATTVVAAQQLRWVPLEEGPVVGLVLLAFVFPTQLLASVLGFLARDLAAGTGMGLLAGTWLSVALVSLAAPFGLTSRVL